jgi:hypothetical protein
VGDRFVQIRAKCLSLGLGELTAAAVFALAGATTLASALPARAEQALWWVLVPLLVVLVQGGCYWLAARRWVGRAAMPKLFVATYRAFRLLDPALLTAGLVGAVWSWPREPMAAALVVVVWAFGALEYVNYFVVRLAFPARRWLSGVRRRSTPALVRDLARS